MKKLLITLVLIFVSSIVSAQTYSKELEKAAKKGDFVAQKDLGVCYLYGYGTDINYKKAYKWLLSSAEQGNADAMFHVGWQLNSRLAPGQGYSGFTGGDGYSWFEKAALLGQQNAIDWLKARDNTLWAREGAERGNKYAQYEYSKEVYSEKERRKWLEKAAVQGHEQAIRDLAAIREKEVQDSLAQVRIEEERLRKQEEERKQILAKKSKWGNLSVQLKKPGTFLSVIPIEALPLIDSLTITGFLYDTDIKVLSSCSDLKYIDLRYAIIGPSPETQREMEARRNFWLGFAGVLSQQADNAYVDFNLSTTDYQFVKTFSKIIEQGSIKGKIISCYVPQNALSELPELTTVLLPITATILEDNALSFCPKLTKVVLPKAVKHISTGCFSYCASLRNIDFPTTVTYIGSWTVRDSKVRCSFAFSEIEKIDLSKCKYEMSSWSCDLKGCTSLKEIRFPQNIKTIEYFDLNLRKGGRNLKAYFPASLESLGDIYYMSWDSGELHFKSTVPPDGALRNCTIYVPKGSTTAYYSKFGNSNKYIEE